MLTGRQPFRGDTAPDILAAVIVRDVDLSALRANLHPRLRELVERCVEKHPKKRYQAIGDVRAEIERIEPAPIRIEPRADGHRPKWQRIAPFAATAAGFALISAAAVWNIRPTPAWTSVSRFLLPLPQGHFLANTVRQVLDISPDGSHVVYIASQKVYVHSLSEYAARAVPGVDAAQSAFLTPIFSPDARSIAFYSGPEQAIKRMPVSGGAAVPVSRIDRPIFGMSWSGDWIVFGQGESGVMRVPAAEGKPEVVAPVSTGEFAYGPRLLPGNTAILFTIARGTGPDRWDKATIVVHSLASGER